MTEREWKRRRSGNGDIVRSDLFCLWLYDTRSMIYGMTGVLHVSWCFVEHYLATVKVDRYFKFNYDGWR